MKTDIQNLLIDFGGVIIDLNRARCIDGLRRAGAGQLAGLLNDFHQEGLFMQYELGRISTAEFRAHIRSCCSNSLSDTQIDALWNSFLVGIPAGKLELLLRLRKRYRLYLLSNTNELHWEWSCAHAFTWQGHQVTDFFDRIYLSYRMQMAKPDISIFQSVLADAGLRPEETLFLDDSEVNCMAARSLGITTYTPQAGEDWSHLFAGICS